MTWSANLIYEGTARCTFYFDDTGNPAHPRYEVSNPGKSLTGVGDMTFAYARYTETTYNQYRWQVTAFSVRDVITNAAYFRSTNWSAYAFLGSILQGGSGSTIYTGTYPTSWSNCNVAFGQSVKVFCSDRNWLSNENTVDDVYLLELTEGGAVNLSPYNSGRIRVDTTIQNNLLTGVTVSVGNQSHLVNTLETSTWSTILEGPLGNTYDITTSWETIVWETSYDPILMVAEANPLFTYERHGRIGTPLTTQKLHLEITNYSEIRDAAVAVKVVGWEQVIGTVNVPKWNGTGLPSWKTLDVSLELPPGSRLRFSGTEGLTIMPTHEQVIQATMFSPAELRYYVSCAETSPQDPLPVSVTATVDPNSGTQWLGVTNTTTGTTSIGTSTVTNPTNTNTTTTGAIDSVTGGASGTGGNGANGTNFGNTSSGISSAATQAIAADIGAIKADVDRLRENSDKQREDQESNLSAGNKAAVKNYIGQFSNPSQAAASAMAGVQASASQAQTAIAGAISSKVGTPDLASIDTTAEPNPGKLTLQVGPGKTVEMVLNPFATDAPFDGLVRKVAGFIKRLIAWALVAAFFYQTMKEVRGACGTAFLTGGYNSQVADFVKSVNIFGWSIGVPVAAAVRIALIALVVTLVLTLPVALLAAVEGGLPWASLKEVYTLGAPASGGGLGGALGYVDYVLPWHLMLSLPAYYILVHNVLFPLQVFWQMVFKFLP